MRYDAKAIGSGSEGAQTELQDSWHKSMTLEEAKVLTLKVLKQVMEEKLDENNVQLAVVTPKQSFSILKKEELQEVISQIETAAPAAEGEQAASTTAAAPQDATGTPAQM